MKNREWTVAEGDTVADAIESALETLQVSEDEVEVVIEEQPRKGLFGMGRRRARVRVRPVVKPSTMIIADAIIAEMPTGGPSDTVTDSLSAGTPDESPDETTETTIQTSEHNDEAEETALQTTVDSSDEEAEAEKSPAEASAAEKRAHPTIALQDGQVIVSTPADRAGDPVIRRGRHTRVWVNDQPVEKEQIVTEEDTIRVEAVDEPPETSIEVEISDDKLTAYMAVIIRPGTRYRLVDAPPSVTLTVGAEPLEEIPAQPPTISDLKDALAKRNVVFGISDEALHQLLRQIEEDPEQAAKPRPVAFGIEAVPTVDEHVELMFERASRVRTELDDHRGDLLGMYKLSSVKAGDLLAVRHPGKKGTPGKTVTGQDIPVKEPRPSQTKAGEGAAWDDARMRIVATRGGRPTMIRNIIAVHPQHSVSGDVDPSTGHIEFDGDVVIRGSVSDSMRVISKGSVSVGDSVSNAHVEADDSVTVGRGIVKSKVVAGARYSRLFQIMALLQPLAHDVDKLVRAVKQVKSDPRLGLADFSNVTDGSLVKRLLDDRFAGVVRRVRELQALVEQKETDLLESDLLQLISTLHRVLVGLGPLSLKNIAELAELQRQAQYYVDDFEDEQNAPFDVVAGFVDNSEVVAGGQIIIRSGGCSYSSLWAGTGVVMNSGVFRGTTIIVNKGDVTVKEIGSRTSAPVRVEIVTNGEFKADIVHPGVVVSIGNQRHAFDNEELNVRVRLVAGELQVRTGV